MNVLVIDNEKDFPHVNEQHEVHVDFFEQIDKSDAITWGKYDAVFTHQGNRATDWAMDHFKNNAFGLLVVFSGGAERIRQSGNYHSLPRALFKRHFDPFLKRCTSGDPISNCAEVFQAQSFAKPPQRADQSDEAAPSKLATFTREDTPPPAWCSFSAPLQRSEGGEALSIDKTLSQLESLESPHLLVLEDSYVDKGDGIHLLLHLRLNAEQAYSRFPVAVRMRHSLETWLRHNPRFRVLTTDRVEVLEANADIDKDQLTELDALSEPDALSKEHHLSVLEELALSPRGLTGRHDLANEWGPVQLWNGVQQLRAEQTYPAWVRKLFFRLTRRQYYKYLFALSGLRGETESFGSEFRPIEDSQDIYDSWIEFVGARKQPIRIGLVDDEAEKGWLQAIEGVFLDAPGAGSVTAPYNASDLEDLDTLVKDASAQDWDIVLVDLRLTESDTDGPPRDAKQLSGVQVIKKLKERQPERPVLAVTASNKAWTAKTLRSAGADGHWIKESPEHGVRLSYTTQNAADLIEALHSILQRYDDACPVWELVRRIASLKDDEALIFRFAQLNRDTDPGQVRKRLDAIQNRLRRAFGFLVMERSDYEEVAFASNRLDLAFLTVWSILNETAALHFLDPPYRGRPLSETRRKQTFRFLDPHDQSVKTYWTIENGVIQQSDPPTPSDSNLEYLIRPTHRDGKPKRPGRNVDNPRIQWLLHRAGEPELAKRFHDDDYKSHYSGPPPLRNLRNSLEETHGEATDAHHASLQDIHDLLSIWNAILFP